MDHLRYILLGEDPAALPPGTEVEFVWTHGVRSWHAFVFLAAVFAVLYGVAWLYRRESEGCSRRWKTVLTVIRGLVLLLVAVVFLGPAKVLSVRKTIEPYVLVLLDDSLSMSIRDRYADASTRTRLTEALALPTDTFAESPPSRADLVEALLQKQKGGLLRRLAEKGQVRVFTFSDTVRWRTSLGEAAETMTNNEAAVETGPPVPPLKALGNATDLARGVEEAVRSAAGSPVACVLVVTDGQATSGANPVDAVRRVAEQDIPVFTLGVGDPREPRNLRLVHVEAPENAFKDDPFSLQARVEAKGYVSVEVRVELREQVLDADTGKPVDDGRVVETKTVTLGAETPHASLAFERTVATPGRYAYTVRIPDDPDELLTADNRRQAVVEVLEERARVLLVAGGPSWEYRMVQNLLVRDKTINVSCWLQSMDMDMRQAGNTVIEHLPRNESELFVYDIVLFFDPDPAEFNQAWVEALQRFVGERGGGMLWSAGPEYSADFLSRVGTEKVQELIPVQLEALDVVMLESATSDFEREWPMRVTASGVDHPILALDEDPQRNRMLWQRLSGVFWTFPARKEKPGMEVLLTHTDPRFRRGNAGRPLLVSGRYGRGRTVYLGFNSTWRWRKSGFRLWERFWVRMVRYLLEGRLQRGGQYGEITTNRDRYTRGDAVQVQARLLRDAIPDDGEETLALHLVAPGSEKGGGRVVLQAVKGRPGRYEGKMIARHVGENELQLDLMTRAEGPVRLSRRFAVELPNREFADPRLNESLLQTLAQESNGAYGTLVAYDELVQRIPNRRERILVRGKPQALWDNKWVMLVLVGLLTVEWFARKRFDLL